MFSFIVNIIKYILFSELLSFNIGWDTLFYVATYIKIGYMNTYLTYFFTVE